MSAYTLADISAPECLDGDEIDEREVALALAAKAEEQCGSGVTHAAEFLTNLDDEHLEAMATYLFAHCESFRTLFADQFGDDVRNRLRSAA